MTNATPTGSAASSKPVILSGIQPSGSLCLGNYLGALQRWVQLQDEYDCIFMVVDLHALTVRQVPAELRRRCLSFVAQYIACGIDPERATIAIQSHVPQHAELAWVLSTLTSMGELGRMTQFKEKSRRGEPEAAPGDEESGSSGESQAANAALFMYPVLMAADILLYQTHGVPVGEDQKQHLELARDLAQRFNHHYSDTFAIPEPFIPKVGARIMSLQDPTKKMSKSDDNANNTIALLDPPDVISRKLRRAVTDSFTDIRFDPERPGLANLLTMYAVMADQPMTEVERRFERHSYAEFKAELTDLTISVLEPIQQRYGRLMKDRGYLDQVLASGAEACRRRAQRTLSKVYRKVGLVEVSRHGR